MNPDEIVRALRTNDLWPQVVVGGKEVDAQRAAADLIERLQVQNEQRYQLYAGAVDTIARLEAQLAASQRREKAAVEDIEKMMRICEKGACHFCANGDCTESPYCSPKWRGPQDGKGAAE